MDFVTEPSMREMFFYLVLIVGLAAAFPLVILSPVLLDLIKDK